MTPLSVAATSTAPSEACADREADMDPCPAATDRARRHAEPRGRVLVEAARRVEACVINRFRDCLRGAQLFRRAARPRLRRIGFRGHARDRLEDAMEVIGAQARARRKPGEFRRLLGLLDLGARPPDRLDLRIGRAEPCRDGSACRRDSPPSRPLRRSGRRRHSRASPPARRSSGGKRFRSCARRRRISRRRPDRGAGPLASALRREPACALYLAHAFRSWTQT